MTIRSYIHAIALPALCAMASCALETADDDAGRAPIPEEEDGNVASSCSAVISGAPFGCGGTRIALRASTGHLLVAEGGGGFEVKADRATIGPWETFTAHDLGFGRIALQVFNGSFVVAEGGGGFDLLANRPSLGPWETFALERHWNGHSWALRSDRGFYVVAENGGGGVVNANRPGIGEWEAFDAICL